MAVQGLTVPIGADASKFNKEIRGMERNTRNLQREVGALSKALEIEWDEKRFTQAQEKAKQAVEQTDVKVQALKDRLTELDETGTSKTSNHYQKIQSDLIKAESQAVLLKDKLEEINQLKMDRLAKNFEETGAKIEGAGKKLTAFSATAAGILASFSAIGLSAISSADDISKISSQLNISAESLQRWQYLAMQTNVEFDELRDSFITVQAEVGKLARGEIDNASQALMDLGFTAEDAAAPMEKNFEKIVYALSAIEDPAQRALIATKLFGESAAARIGPLLNSGADGMATLTAEFESLGYMTNEQVNSLAEFDNVMNRLKQIFTNLKNEIGAALLPIMQMLAIFIEEKIVPAIRKFADWFKDLSESQMLAITGTLAFIAALAPTLLIIGKMTAGIGGLIRSFGGLSKALTTLSAHPIIAIIGVVIGLFALLYAKNEEFRESINTLVASLGSALAPILNMIMDLLNILMDVLNPVINLIGNTLAPIINMLSGAFASLAPIINLTLLPIQMLAKQLEFIVLFLSPIIDLIGKLANIITGLLGKALDFISNKVSGVIEKIMGWVETGINWIIDKVNFIIRSINKLGSVIGLTISELDDVDLSTQITSEPQITTEQEQITDAENVLNQTNVSPTPQTITNNDYSQKNITVELNIENYGEELDYDSVIREINLRLAEQM